MSRTTAFCNLQKWFQHFKNKIRLAEKIKEPIEIIPDIGGLEGSPFNKSNMEEFPPVDETCAEGAEGVDNLSNISNGLLLSVLEENT